MITIENIDNFLENIKINKECIAYKPFGTTPKELVDIFVEKCNFSKGCFTGRLDPMAHGTTILLFDEKCKYVAKYHSLNKIYRFRMVLNINTTSLDLLGIPTIFKDNKNISQLDISNILEKYKNDYNQTLPVHSSYQVQNINGLKKPLWWWAKENRLSEIIQPVLPKKLYDFKIINKTFLTLSDISNLAIDRINKISKLYDFNQQNIIESWNQYIDCCEKFQIFEIEVSVNSGFYIRSLVKDIGENLGIYTTTLDIERIKYF